MEQTKLHCLSSMRIKRLKKSKQYIFLYIFIITFTLLAGLLPLSARENTIAASFGISGGTQIWKGSIGYGGYVQSELYFHKIPGFAVRPKVGFLYAAKDSFHYYHIPLFIGIGYRYKPFSIPLYFGPILYVGASLCHRWDNSGNSDYLPAFAATPSLLVRYVIRNTVSVILESGYAFDINRSYRTGTVEIMIGFEYHVGGIEQSTKSEATNSHTGQTK